MQLALVHSANQRSRKLQ